MVVRPVTLRAANALVERLHRHHPPARGCLFCLSVVDDAGEVRGVAIVGRPVARMLQDGVTAEVIRVATDGALTNDGQGSMGGSSMSDMHETPNARHTAETWNAAYPVGTRVRYWPILPPIRSAPPRDTETRSEAWTIASGHVVVKVKGLAGGVHLSHVEVLP